MSRRVRARMPIPYRCAFQSPRSFTSFSDTSTIIIKPHRLQGIRKDVQGRDQSLARASLASPLSLHCTRPFQTLQSSFFDYIRRKWRVWQFYCRSNLEKDKKYQGQDFSQLIAIWQWRCIKVLSLFKQFEHITELCRASNCAHVISWYKALFCRTFQVFQTNALPVTGHKTGPSTLPNSFQTSPLRKQRRAFAPSKLYAEKKEVNAAAVETETDLSAELAKYVKNIKPKVNPKKRTRPTYSLFSELPFPTCPSSANSLFCIPLLLILCIFGCDRPIFQDLWHLIFHFWWGEVISSKYANNYPMSSQPQKEYFNSYL